LHDRSAGRVYAYAPLFAIAIAGAWLRLHNIRDQSIWYDEAVSWYQSSGTLAELIASTALDNYPPLHNLLLFAALNMSGSDADWALRLPSALLGIANLIAIFWLGSLVGGRLTGNFAAALLAASSMHIFYSQEARMYSLLALAATLYAASALHFMKSPTISRATLLAVCGLALVYSHPFGTLNWIAITAPISAHLLLMPDFPRRGLVVWIAANAAIAACFLPWALLLLGRAQKIAGGFWIPYPSVDHVLDQLSQLTGGWLWGVALLTGAGVGLRCNFRALAVLLVWLVGPIAVALIVSLVSTPIFLGRYFIGGLPALVTLAAAGMAYLARRSEWHGRAGAAALLACVIIGSLMQDAPRPRDDWRAVAAHLDERLQDSGCVLVYPPWQRVPLRYYVRRPICALFPRRIARIDVQSLPARRLIVVLLNDSSEMLKPDLLRAALKPFTREVGSRTLQNFTILEFEPQR
jgi:mannosyltransferase